MSLCVRCEELKKDSYREDKRCLSHRLNLESGYPNVPPDRLRYEFTDFSTGKPVPIVGKRHWRDHMKRNGLTDNFSFNSKTGTLKNRAPERFKERLRAFVERGVAEGIKRAYYKPYFDRRILG